MLSVKPFRAWRPKKEIVEEFVVPPYDVLKEEDVKTIASTKEPSFIHVTRSEVDVEEGGNKVYEKAYDNFRQFMDEGVLIQEEKPCFYVYQEIYEGHVQTGYVVIASVADYHAGRIVKHELTLTEKQEDRINHFRHCRAQTEPVFLFSPELVINQEYLEAMPIYDFQSDDHVIHRLWRVDDEKQVEEIQKQFGEFKNMYIADGHHRTASAASVSQRYDGGILSVVFPAEELWVLPYHRLIALDDELNREVFERKLSEHFTIEEVMWHGETPEHGQCYWLDGEKNYLLTYKDLENKMIPQSLDSYIVQKFILEPIFDVKDPKTDPRLDFVGGVEAMNKLERAVERGLCAIVMPATSVEEIMAVGDADKIMPPKSTWFEPKLISGLFVYEYE